MTPMPEHEDFEEARKRVGKAITAITTGDPEPYLACWSRGPDVTLFAAGGSNPRGWPAVAEPLERIARHFEGHRGHVCEDEVVHVSQDLAVSIGYQRGDPGGDAADDAEETLLRVTHVFRGARRVRGRSSTGTRTRSAPPRPSGRNLATRASSALSVPETQSCRFVAIASGLGCQ
jgi:ketosteroid isomerase-like protein